MPATRSKSRLHSSPKLPIEIVQAIINLLGPGQLARAMAVSRTFYHLSALLLYNTVLIVNTEDKQHWGLPAARHSHSLFDAPPEEGTEEPAYIPFEIVEPKANSTPSIEPLPDSFSYTKHLTIQVLPDTCELSSLSLPNLQAVRIIPDGDPCPGVCYRPKLYSKKAHKCRFPPNLRPRKLIIGGDNTPMVASGVCPHLRESEDQPFPPPFIKHVIFYMGDDCHYEGEEFLPSLPDTLERISLVFEPRNREAGGTWRRELDCQDEENRMPEGERSDPLTLFDDIAVPCAANAQVAEVVGLEQINAKWLGRGWTAETAKQGIRHAVVTNLTGGPRYTYEPREVTLGEEEAKRRAEAIQFITRAEFEERERREEGSA